MLARAARRRFRRDAFRPPTRLSEQLTLPQLCATQIRWAASSGPDSRDSRIQRQPSSLSTRHATRSLATAAATQTLPSASPFDAFMQPWSARSPQPGMANLTPGNLPNPLILHDVAVGPEDRVKFGIGGDPEELHQNLHACLRVGRMDRATAIVERLAKMYSPSAAEVIEAHNVFLQAMFELAEQNPTEGSMAEIEEWYDTHMVRQAIQPSPETFVTLLRAAMTFLDGSEKDHAIRKYLHMAQEFDGDFLQDINESEEFSDEEWHTLIRFQPERFKEPAPLAQKPNLHVDMPAGYESLIEHGVVPNPMHHIKPVEQKGYGLESLKASLRMFEPGSGVAYPHEMEGSTEDKKRAFAYMRQLMLETDSATTAVKRWKAEDQKLQDIGIHGVLKTKPVQALMWHWYEALLPLIKKEMARTKAVLASPSPANATDGCHRYGPYLEQCDPAKIAALAVSRVVQGCARSARAETQSLRVAVLSATIGEDIERQVSMDAKEKHEKLRKQGRKRERKALLNALAHTSQGSMPVSKPDVVREEAWNDGFTRQDFPSSVRLRLGALALDLLLQAATVTVTADDPSTGKQLHSTQPAFHHHTGFVNGKRQGWIAPHHEILKKVQNESVQNIAIQKMPMVFEPKPWTGFKEGGYYKMNDTVVRTKNGDKAQRAYAQSAISNGDMEKVLSGLDVLGKVPWQINRELFTVMSQAWNAGEGIGGMVPEELNVERPPEPAPDAPPMERQIWYRKLKTYENLKTGAHSQRCYQNFQLEIARAYAMEDKIYFPHNVDFRGRAYPIPPLLNHIGADLARSLLRFANGKELGTVGLHWLKVHLANLYGFDKASLRDREQFSMDNLDEIYDSATNPLSGRRWWTKAEDPWQCLSCCMELKNALDSPDPTRFISHLPVHQDGTCNGLQHYAALGGDRAGATQVNLEPSDRPQDIYTGVAELVKESVAEDAAKGHALGLFLDGKITRKVVKRTVMTNVYGVTFQGAKLQVLDELKDIFPNFEPMPELQSLARPAMYIASKIFKALGKIFNGAQEIQYWLGECGDRITTSISPEQIRKMYDRETGTWSLYDSKYQAPRKENQTAVKKANKSLEQFKTSIIWTTPLKMPVVQPYRKNGKETIRTNIQDITIAKSSPGAVIDKRKQLQAFPPNFIHSLDATHMLLSALKCNEMGLDFAAVHDSFWTHAADVPNLNTVLRDAFVRMHSEDIIDRLAAEFKARYAGYMYRATVYPDSDVGRKIVAWRRSVRSGNTKVRDASFDEVGLEAKRQELLRSEDPEMRREGEKMVTPTSIWLAEPDPKALFSPRLALLGSRTSSSAKLKEVKEKVLGAEAETMEDELEEDSLVESDASEDTPDKTEALARGSVEGSNPISVWVPLAFPPVPKKGDWDITRLRESEYFFS